MKDNNVPNITTLPHFAQDYINNLAVINKSPNTQYAYTNELHLFFQFLCNSIPTFPLLPVKITLLLMERITHLDVEAYINWAKIERNNKVRTLARKQAVIRSLYKYLFRKDMIIHNAARLLEPMNESQKLPKALDANQIADLTDVLQNGTGLSKDQLKYYAYIQKRNYAIFLTFMGTGLSLSELCHLNLKTTYTRSISA